MKLIDLYKKWMEMGTMCSGDVPNGLCQEIPFEYMKTWDLIKPTDSERIKLFRQGFCDAYWASGLKRWHKDETKAFTPLRQTIVLLICAMHDEL